MENNKETLIRAFIGCLQREIDGCLPKQLNQIAFNCGITIKELNLLKKCGLLAWSKSKYFVRPIPLEQIMKILDENSITTTEQAVRYLQKKGFYVEKSVSHANTAALQRLRNQYLVLNKDKTLKDTLVVVLKERFNVSTYEPSEFEKKSITFLKSKKYKILKPITEYKEI